MTGLVLNVVAAVLVTQRLFFLAGLAFIVGSLMDTLDGRYSRMSGKGTLFGAFLDSTLDRIEEGIVADRGRRLLRLAGRRAGGCGDVVVVVLGSLMVSYTRARAEALGVECKVGFATRPVRVVLLSAGLLFAKGAGLGDFELLGAGHLRDGGLTVFTVGPADLACAAAARRATASRRRVTTRPGRVRVDMTPAEAGAQLSIDLPITGGHADEQGTSGWHER